MVFLQERIPRFEVTGLACYDHHSMMKILLLAFGWATFGCGVLLLPVPLPLPFPAGPILLLIGCAILTSHSKTFRRGVQRLRFRYGWLSRAMIRCASRAPRMVKLLVERTNPLVLERLARMRSRHSGVA